MYNDERNKSNHITSDKAITQYNKNMQTKISCDAVQHMSINRKKVEQQWCT